MDPATKRRKGIKSCMLQLVIPLPYGPCNEEEDKDEIMHVAASHKQYDYLHFCCHINCCLHIRPWTTASPQHNDLQHLYCCIKGHVAVGSLAGCHIQTQVSKVANLTAETGMLPHSSTVIDMLPYPNTVIGMLLDPGMLMSMLLHSSTVIETLSNPSAETGMLLDLSTVRICC